MEVRFWAQTDVGRQRDHNEDNFLVDKKLNLFIVADGMGGHAAGEVASAAAVHEVRRYLVEHHDVLRAYDQDPEKGDPLKVNGLIEAAVQHACARIHQLAVEDPSRRGMGTTIDVLMVVGGRGFIGHVGDSRVYMLRQGTIHQMTVDHSLVNELIRRGRLKPGQAFESPFKNAVTRAVGVYPSVDVDTMDFDILAGDRFLLCTDGLSGYLDVRPDTLPGFFGRNDLNEVTRSLIDFANQSGGKDNITAVVVEAQPESEELAARVATELRMKMDALKGIQLIRYLTYRELVKLLSITETATHSDGDTIIREGDPGDSFFVLLEGKVRIFKGDTPIAELDGGAHFGEMALVDSAPRSATVKALGTCKTLSIPREKFYDLLRNDAQVAVKLLWAFVQVLTVRLRLSSTELAERMTEQELVEQMEPLFQEVSPGHAVSVLSEAEEIVDLKDVALELEEVEAIRSDDNVMAPDTSYSVLEKEAKRATGSSPEASPAPPAPRPQAAAPAADNGQLEHPTELEAPTWRPADLDDMDDDDEEITTSPGQRLPDASDPEQPAGRKR